MRVSAALGVTRHKSSEVKKHCAVGRDGCSALVVRGGPSAVIVRGGPSVVIVRWAQRCHCQGWAQCCQLSLPGAVNPVRTAPSGDGLYCPFVISVSNSSCSSTNSWESYRQMKVRLRNLTVDNSAV